jgi:hypothetical protein
VSERAWRRAYFLAIGAAFALVAWSQSELLARFLEDSARRIARGGAARWRTVAEDGLFWAMVAWSWLLVAARPRPRSDPYLLAAAAAAGWTVEAWGTRSGLWSYYTGQTPPPWILVAWTAGALVVARLAETPSPVWARVPGGSWRPVFWGFLAAAQAMGLPFVWSRSPAAGTALLLGLGAFLAWRPRPERDGPALAAGFVCVLFADLWGTTNSCYRYHCQDGSLVGIARGILFGALFDSLVVAAILKALRI